MLSGLPTPQTILPNHPSINRPKINQSLSGSNLHFNGADTVKPKISLPSWTQQVKDPAVTLPSLMAEVESFSESLKGPNPPGFFSKIGQGLTLFRRSRSLFKEITSDQAKYLPKEAEKELSRYHWTPRYWWDRLFNSKHAKLMDVVYQGPMIIKAKQQAVGMLPVLYDTLKGVEVERQKQTGLTKLLFYFPIRTLKRKINELEGYTPLLNRVPPLPYSQFEKQLNDLKAEYKKTHASDPIETIQKEPIGTGSMGQVYQAKTKSGKSLVLKVIRPNLTEAYLDGFLPFTYYKTLLLKGCDLKDKQEAAGNAQNTVDLLKTEVHPDQEAHNTQQMKQCADKIGVGTFQIPEVLAATKAGIIFPFLGKKDLADVSPMEQAAFKAKLAPDIARYLLLANAKPLDLHNGNMRIGQPAAWLDHGRQVNIPEETHQKMLELMIAAFKAPQTQTLSVWDNALLQTDTRDKLKDLLKINPEANRQALERLDKIEEFADLSAQVVRQGELQKDIQSSNSFFSLLSNVRTRNGSQAQIQEQLSEIQKTLQPFNETKTLLSQILGQPNIGASKVRLPFLMRAQQEPLASPSVLNAWASSAMNLKGFAKATLPQSDIEQYNQKTQGFLAPYLQANTQEETDQKLEELANILANAVVKQSNATLNDAEMMQLANTMKEGLRKDLPVKLPSTKTS